MFQPIAQGLVGWCAEWHDTLLVAFAGHFHRAVAECHVGHVESDQFRHTHAGGIRAVPAWPRHAARSPVFSYRFLRSRLHAVLINAVHQLLRLRSFNTAGSVSGIFGVCNEAAGLADAMSWSYAHAKNPRTATVLRAMLLRA